MTLFKCMNCGKLFKKEDVVKVTAIVEVNSVGEPKNERIGFVCKPCVEEITKPDMLMESGK